ncbi:MAG: ABC transporter ATP-binding protein [Pseudomonadota bacterium]
MVGTDTSTRAAPAVDLIAPIKGRIWLACAIQAIAAVAGIIPFIAVAELGRVLLAEPPLDVSRAWTIASVAVGALAVRLVCLMAAAAITHIADLDLQLDLRRRMAAHLARVPLGWFGERNAGLVKKALQDDVSAIHHLVGHSYTNMVSATVTPLAALSYLIWVDWWLTIVALVPVAIGIGLYAAQYRGYGEKMEAYGRALADVNTAAVEFAQGIAVIKAFGQAQSAHVRFIERTRDFVHFFWEWMRGLLVMSAATEIVLSPLFTLLAVLTAGLLMIGVGLTTPLEVLPFVILAPALTAPFMTLSYAQNDMMVAQRAAERIADLLNRPHLAAPVNPTKPKGSHVAFRDVSFAYDGKTQAVSDIDLVLEPGTVTALVGPSGSGKSTLARLLPRFWDVTRGSIEIGGVPVTDMTSDTLYGSVSFVFQDVQLLRSSIADNIALGRPDAPEIEIEGAARAAQIHDRIISLPHGYRSVVGEDAHLSGGEAQRVSIARALLADAPILVLDEATSFADPESEAAIQDALSTLVAGRTLLVIAHRLHTITGADQICVLDGGRIVERGSHGDLLAEQGLYTDLWAAHRGGSNRVEVTQ